MRNREANGRSSESLVDEGKRSRLVGLGPEAPITLFKPGRVLQVYLLIELNCSGKRKPSRQLGSKYCAAARRASSS
jgi:hypothetical protein